MTNEPRLWASISGLVSTLEWFISRAKIIPQSRWPCPECHRKNISAPLLIIDHRLEDGTKVLSGCYTCNMEPIVRQAETVLAEFQKQVLASRLEAK